MRRGTGLMAGSPGGSARPGLVTVPTPSPAAMTMSSPLSLKLKPLSCAPSSHPDHRQVLAHSSPCGICSAAARLHRIVTLSPSGRQTSTLRGDRFALKNHCCSLGRSRGASPGGNIRFVALSVSSHYALSESKTGEPFCKKVSSPSPSPKTFIRPLASCCLQQAAGKAGEI